MTELPIFDNKGVVLPYVLKALKQVMHKYDIEIAVAIDKFETVQALWLKEFNATLVIREKEQHFTSIRFVNSADCLKFSLTFY